MNVSSITSIEWDINLKTPWIVQLLLCLLGALVFSLTIILNYLCYGGLTSTTTAFQGFINLKEQNLTWKAAYVFGILATTSAAWDIFGFDSGLFLSTSQYTYGLSNFGFMLSGFMAGFGWSMFRASSRGHTLLEAAKQPKMAVIHFSVAIVFALITINVRYYTGFLFVSNPNVSENQSYEIINVNLFLILTGVLLITTVSMNPTLSTGLRSFFCFLMGCTHCFGLLMGQAANRLLQLQSLTFNFFWDPLPLIFVGASFIFLLLFGRFLLSNKTKPILEREFEEEVLQLLPEETSSQGNARCPNCLSIGSTVKFLGLAVFGVSFGLSGLTGQTALMGMALYNWSVAMSYLPFLLIGIMSWEKTLKYFRKKSYF